MALPDPRDAAALASAVPGSDPGSSSAVIRRLNDAALRHEARLAALTSLRSAAALDPAGPAEDIDAAFGDGGSGSGSLAGGAEKTSAGGGSGGGGGGAGGGGTGSLASLARLRSRCPQPPLDDPHLLGGSAAPPPSALVVELELNPPERVAPHRIAAGAAPLIDVGCSGGASGGGFMGPASGGGYDPEGEEAAANALKAITALSALCDEADDLRRAAEGRVLPQLALFGSDLHLSGHGDVDVDAANGGRGAVLEAAMMDEGATRRRDSELLRRMGKFLPSLQGAFNLALRCQRLVRNMVCQIGGCASPSFSSLDGSGMAGGGGGGRGGGGGSPGSLGGTGPPVLGPSVRLLPVASAVARTLRLLLCLDAVIQSNPELHEAWDLYKSVMRDRAIKLQREGVRDARMESFERLLVQLDYTLLSGRSFEICAEQNFDPGTHCRGAVPLAGEGASKKGGASGKGAEGGFALHSELRHLLTALYRRVCSQIESSASSVDSDPSLSIGLYGLYCLYRRLLPSRLVPDASLHKALWNLLPSRRPVLPLYGSAPFFPRQFLLRYAPYEGLRGCGAGVDPADIPSQTALEHAAKSKQSEAEFVTAVRKMEAECMRWLAAAETDLAPSANGDGLNGDGGRGGAGGGNDGDDGASSVAGDLPPGVSPASLSDDDRAVASVARKVARLRRGVALARRARSLLRRHLLTHRALEMPLPPSHIPLVGALCRIVKSVEKALRARHRAAAISLRGAAVHATARGLHGKFERLRGAVDAHGAAAASGAMSVDADSEHSSATARTAASVGAALSVLEGILKGSSTGYSPARRHALEISACICAGGAGALGVGNGGGDDAGSAASAGAGGPFLAAVRPLLDDLGLLSDMDEAVRAASDCSFLYFHRGLLPSIVRDLYQSGGMEGPGGARGGGGAGSAGGLQLVLSAFSDPERELLRCFSTPRGGDNDDGDGDRAGPYLAKYQEFLRDALRTELVDPLCQRIETDLRLASFARDAAGTRGYSPVNPRQDRGHKFRPVLEMPPLHFCDGTVVDVRDEVRRRLQGAFYEFRAVALHDGGAYSTMRSIARAMHGLDLENDGLPPGSFRERVDVVDILRNIDAFVSRYNYDMNQQLFIQRRPDEGAKFFSSISMKCICTSVRHHGLGVVEGSLDMVHRCLFKRLEALSRALSNDRLRSLVAKESRWLGGQMNVSVKGYPFDRAAEFVADIGKLDAAEDGTALPVLERLRRAVTELGNALGFVRTLKSAEVRLRSEGSLRSSSSAAGRGGELAGAAGRGPSEGGGSAMDAIPAVGAKMDPGSRGDCLEALVERLRGDVRGWGRSRMDNFYLLIPALCLSWTEASLQGKEMMHKQNLTRDAYFADDGLAFGLACLLVVLGQDGRFDEISWFPSVREKFEREGRALAGTIAAEEARRAAALAGQKSGYFSFSRHPGEEAKAEDAAAAAAAAAEDDELAAARAKQRSLSGLEREMNTLFFAIHGARIFLRRKTL